MKIGFIGLGAMGSHMLKRLAKAYPSETYAYDQDQAVLNRVCDDTHSIPSASVTDLASNVDIIFSCVPNNDVVRSIYLGEASVEVSAKPDSITIDCSTVGPDVTREVYTALKSNRIHHLDASMLGSVKQAVEGTISFVVGGDVDSFQRAEPVLSACGELIRHCGPSGAGNHMKLIHQTLVAGHAVAVSEAMGLCLETGADIETFYDIVTQGTGFAYSRYFENRVPRMRQGDFSALFMLKFMHKDAKLAQDMVSDAENKFPALAAAIQTLEIAMNNGHGEDDFSAAMKTVESRTGLKIHD